MWGGVVSGGQVLVLSVEFGSAFLTIILDWLVSKAVTDSVVMCPFLPNLKHTSCIDFSLQIFSKLNYEKSSYKRVAVLAFISFAIN